MNCGSQSIELLNNIMDEYDNYIDFHLENPENDAQRAREKAEADAKKSDSAVDKLLDDLLKMVEN